MGSKVDSLVNFFSMVDKFKYKNKIKDVDALNVTQFPQCRFLHFTDVSAENQE